MTRKWCGTRISQSRYPHFTILRLRATFAVLFEGINGSLINNFLRSKRFIAHFFRRGSQIGSITPSSRFLAKKIIQRIPFDRCEIFVELGPGTGAFTTSLLNKMSPTSQLILIELNEVFYKALQDSFQDPRVTVGAWFGH
ncbi:MAG: hypothetical protein EB023_12950 [Flavobacteriia bacterium]|nr:hypothetical protein [Flavobacteriia bacterium]